MEPMPVSFHGVIHYSRLKDRVATQIVPFEEFEKDAAAGTLPDFSLIEPNMLGGHGDYHPALGRAMGPGIDPGVDSPSSILSGETFLQRVYDAYRSATSVAGPNVWNTALLIGWDEPGGTYDHVPPGPVPPPDPAAPAGEFGFTFDRSGYRVPAIIVSPWVEQGAVYNDEYRHTSLIATLRKSWGLGEPLTGRDAIARTFEGVFTLDEPRDPATWPDVQAQPVPEWTMDPEVVGRRSSAASARALVPGLIAHAKAMGVPLPPGTSDDGSNLTGRRPRPARPRRSASTSSPDWMLGAYPPDGSSTSPGATRFGN